jgi:hypothetical protein
VISVDVSATASGPLTISTDFGDGTVVAGPARHVYAIAGSFTITCSAVDSRGRAVTGSRTIAVKSVPYQPFMKVTQTGGPDDGRVWTLHYDDGPG